MKAWHLFLLGFLSLTLYIGLGVLAVITPVGDFVIQYNLAGFYMLFSLTFLAGFFILILCGIAFARVDRENRKRKAEKAQ